MNYKERFLIEYSKRKNIERQKKLKRILGEEFNEEDNGFVEIFIEITESIIQKYFKTYTRDDILDIVYPSITDFENYHDKFSSKHSPYNYAIAIIKKNIGK